MSKVIKKNVSRTVQYSSARRAAERGQWRQLSTSQVLKTPRDVYCTLLKFFNAFFAGMRLSQPDNKAEARRRCTRVL